MLFCAFIEFISRSYSVFFKSSSSENLRHQVDIHVDDVARMEKPGNNPQLRTFFAFQAVPSRAKKSYPFAPSKNKEKRTCFFCFFSFHIRQKFEHDSTIFMRGKNPLQTNNNQPYLTLRTWPISSSLCAAAATTATCYTLQLWSYGHLEFMDSIFLTPSSAAESKEKNFHSTKNY